MNKNLKMAQMIHGHRKSNATSVYSYHGSRSMFDDQDCFNAIIDDPAKFYKATLNENGGVIFERDIDNAVMEKMVENILFEVFLYEFKKQYVGGCIRLNFEALFSTTHTLASFKA